MPVSNRRQLTHPDVRHAIREPVRLLALVALGVAATLPPMAAANEKPAYWVVNGGWAPTVGTTSDYLKAGWNLGTGFVFKPAPSSPVAIQLDLGYADFNATSKLIELGQSESFR